MKVLLESSTESEWAARALEELGHEVIVADPNFAPMYATRNKMGEDRQARCRRLGAGLPAGRSSASAPSERCAAARADAALGEGGGGGIPQRLRTMPSVGPITSAALVACFDGAQRFHTVQQARSYLGLVPRELSSGEQQ